MSKAARFVVQGGAERVLFSRDPEEYLKVITEKDGTRAIHIEDEGKAARFRELVALRAERSGRQPIIEAGTYDTETGAVAVEDTAATSEQTAPDAAAAPDAQVDPEPDTRPATVKNSKSKKVE